RRRLDLVLVGAGDRNLQFGGEVEAALSIQRDLAGYFRSLRINAVLFRDQHQGLAVAGRPAQREQLFGIMAVAGAAELLRKTHREAKDAVFEHRASVASA